MTAGGRRAALADAAAAIACIAAVGMGLSLTLPLLALRLEEMGLSKTAIGAQVTATALASLATVPFVPRVAARLGTRRTLLFALALGALCLLAFPFVPHPAAWLAIRLGLSVSLNALFVLSEFWITAAAPAASRGFVLGVYGTVLSLGFAAGPLVLAAVGSTGIAPFVVGAAIFALASLPVWLAGRDVPSVAHASGNPLSLIRRAPVASLAGLVFGAVESSAMSFLVLHGTRNGLGDTAAAALLTALGLGSALLQLPMGVAADRFERRRLLLACAGLGAIGALGWSLVPLASVPGFVVTLAWGGVIAGIYLIGLAQLSARFQGPDLAMANATYVTLYGLGMLVGPPLTGAIMDAAPASGFPVAMAAMLGLYALVPLARILTSERRSRT